MFIATFTYAQGPSIPSVLKPIPMYFRSSTGNTLGPIKTDLPFDTYNFVLNNFSPKKTEKIIGFKINLKLENNPYLTFNEQALYEPIDKEIPKYYFSDGNFKLDMNQEHPMNMVLPNSVKYEFGYTKNCSFLWPINKEINWTDSQTGIVSVIHLSGSLETCHNELSTESKDILFVDKRGDKVSGEFTMRRMGIDSEAHSVTIKDGKSEGQLNLSAGHYELELADNEMCDFKDPNYILSPENLSQGTSLTFTINKICKKTYSVTMTHLGIVVEAKVKWSHVEINFAENDDEVNMVDIGVPAPGDDDYNDDFGDDFDESLFDGIKVPYRIVGMPFPQIIIAALPSEVPEFIYTRVKNPKGTLLVCWPDLEDKNDNGHFLMSQKVANINPKAILDLSFYMFCGEHQTDDPNEHLAVQVDISPTGDGIFDALGTSFRLHSLDADVVSDLQAGEYATFEVKNKRGSTLLIEFEPEDDDQ